MKRWIFVFLVVVWMQPAISSGEEWTGNIHLLLGAKVLEEEWEPAEEHAELGATVDFAAKHWPLNIVVTYLASEGDGSATTYVSGFGWVSGKFEAETRELNVGVKKYWDATQVVKPFAGGGLSMIDAKFKGRALGTPVSDDDDAVGFWIGGGVLFRLRPHLSLGVEGSFSYAEVTLFGVDSNGGGGHGLFSIGYHW